LQSGSPAYFSPSKEFVSHGESLRQPELQKTAPLSARRKGFSVLPQKLFQTKFKDSPDAGTLLALWEMRERMDAGDGCGTWRPVAGKEAAALSGSVQGSIRSASSVNLLSE
jgi:hypothetical protein